MPRAQTKQAPAQTLRPYARNTPSETVSGLLTPTQPNGKTTRTIVAQSAVIVATRLVAVWPQVCSHQTSSALFENSAKAGTADSYCAALSTALSHQHVKQLGTASVYVAELLKRSRTTYAALQLALLLMIRYSQTSGRLTANIGKCGRRALLAALMLASKALNDRSVRTVAWAKVSGLSCAELNCNEMEMLKALDWSLDVSPECYGKWCQMVLTISEVPTVQTCRETLLATPPPEAVAPPLLSPIGSP